MSDSSNKKRPRWIGEILDDFPPEPTPVVLDPAIARPVDLEDEWGVLLPPDDAPSKSR